MYRNRKRRLLLLFSFLIGCCITVTLIYWYFSVYFPRYKAEDVVEEFYAYEQAGNFGDSWTLLHPLMKEKWPLNTYITDRSHVFIGHFGAETFKYKVELLEEVDGWRMTEGSPRFTEVYKFEVVQHYKGKYGAFAFIQYVYVVKHKGEYVVLWDYNI